MKKYFKVMLSYDQNDFIPIDETELEKALYAFIASKPVVFQNGATSRIHSVVPDWHRAMGWAYSWKLGPDDWNELDDKGVRQGYGSTLALAKEKVEHLLQTGRTDLIGKNISIPKIEGSLPETKQLTDKFKI